MVLILCIITIPSKGFHMAEEKDPKPPVDVTVTEGSTPTEAAHIEVKTGLTDGKKYLITVRPRTGRPVLIAVHL